MVGPKEIAVGVGVAAALAVATTFLNSKNGTIPSNEDETMSAAIPILTQIKAALDQQNQNIGLLLTEIQKQGTEAQQTTFTEILTVGTTASVLFPNSNKVRGAVIMNLSTTDVITIVSGVSTFGTPAAITAGQGFLLNPAPAAGMGGGTLNVPNIDLASLTAVTDTNNTQKILVVYWK